MELYEQETKILESLLANKQNSEEDQDWSEEARLREREIQNLMEYLMTDMTAQPICPQFQGVARIIEGIKNLM